jgi:hypothetical protein
MGCDYHDDMYQLCYAIDLGLIEEIGRSLSTTISTFLLLITCSLSNEYQQTLPG